MTFMNKVTEGIETLDSVDIYIEDWSKNHRGTIGLQEFLGMTRHSNNSDNVVLETISKRSRLQTILSTSISTLYA